MTYLNSITFTKSLVLIILNNKNIIDNERLSLLKNKFMVYSKICIFISLLTFLFMGKVYKGYILQ